MPTKQKFTTNAAAPQKFRPHGRVEFSSQGNILISEVIGPFNVELVNAVANTEVAQFEEFIARGKWGDIIIFRESAMASHEALAAVTANVRKNIEIAHHPSATALVLAHCVEGATLMAHRHLQCFLDGGYTQAGIPIAVFEDEGEAVNWLKSVLNRTNSSDL